MKKFFVVALAFALSACNASPEDQMASMEAVRDNLPKGCELFFAGNVQVEGSHFPSRVFVTKCDQVVTTSSTRTVQTGKTSHQQTDVTIAY